MSVHKQYYYGTPGLYILSAPELAYVTILHVEREGMGYHVKDTSVSSGERACQYNPTGQLIFDSDNPFYEPAPADPLTALEKLFVLWKD